MRVDGQLQLDDRVGGVDLELRFGDGVVDAVVDVEGRFVAVADAVAADVAFVREDQRGGKRADRHSAAFIVVADRGNDQAYLFRREIQVIQQPERHDRPRLTVVNAVNKVADVMEIAGNFYQLDHPLVVTERAQNVTGFFRHERDVRKTVFGKSQRRKRHIRLPDIGVDHLIFLDRGI